ncbi:hypothetical protein ACOSP7_018655 [Xanthoceras sorbifolium]
MVFVFHRIYCLPRKQLCFLNLEKLTSIYFLKIYNTKEKDPESEQAIVMPNIRAIELEDFITGERRCPSKFVEVPSSNGVDKELVLNPEFSAWKRFDQFFLGWLLSTISEGLIGQVTKCMTSLEAWKTLDSMFSQQSMAKVL